MIADRMMSQTWPPNIARVAWFRQILAQFNSDFVEDCMKIDCKLKSQEPPGFHKWSGNLALLAAGAASSPDVVPARSRVRRTNNKGAMIPCLAKIMTSSTSDVRKLHGCTSIRKYLTHFGRFPNRQYVPVMQ